MTAHNDCHQEDKISNIQYTLERFEATLEKLNSVLEKIAEQGATLKSLQEAARRHDKSLENIFHRLGALEVKSEGEKVKVGAIMAGISAGVAFVTAALVKLLMK